MGTRLKIYCGLFCLLLIAVCIACGGCGSAAKDTNTPTVQSGQHEQMHVVQTGTNQTVNLTINVSGTNSDRGNVDATTGAKDQKPNISPTTNPTLSIPASVIP